jgi:hypothetical protein
MDMITPAVFPKGTAGEGPGTGDHENHHGIKKKLPGKEGSTDPLFRDIELPASHWRGDADVRQEK